MASIVAFTYREAVVDVEYDGEHHMHVSELQTLLDT